ncbi:MAG: peroxiredoxin family protein [Desulfarculaceae bacterium]|nr:peroxiredoxin family protein [Desulfarculaceae bacterium]MCF8048303.1 peroxiredoxin family protein [Desulfarculaceae bacterium]MCF8064623.1 peroxiredoxin family protein [Desulfarculaceae bacterium]MCF8096637.1 peroxiredoxin family protein [Desulfarculaceae bacterium]MCF8123680.1 peroxiredoxin family protein [Desulfarculaceae bacterium]
MTRMMMVGLGLVAALWAWAALAGGLAVGQAAPDFQVASGDEQALALDGLKGKVVVVFYEGRDQVEYSRTLKQDLNRFFHEQPPEIQKLVVRVPVVDCSPANWITKGFWADGLSEASKKEGLTVYGDWDGAMRQAYGLPEDGSSFLVVGPGGKVRYLALDTRQLGPPQYQKIRDAIIQATTEAMAR